MLLNRFLRNNVAYLSLTLFISVISCVYAYFVVVVVVC